MPNITFSWAPDYSDKDSDINVSNLDASVEYSIDIPKGVDVTVNDIYTHVNYWLRGCGYYIDLD